MLSYVQAYEELEFENKYNEQKRKLEENVHKYKEAWENAADSKREALVKYIQRRDNINDVKQIVHIIPHTHDDVGWGKTVDQYFSGSSPGKAHVSVNNIISTVVRELLKNPKRTFTYVEMKFFNMWYKMQDKKTQQNVKNLIKSGQLEIAQGGWAATDEACPNYEDMILNMHKGH